MSKINWPLVMAVAVMTALLVFLYNVRVSVAHDMDHHEFDAWYESLKQPDSDLLSCCGVADAYFCGNPYTRNGKNYCKLDDDRIIPRRTPHPVGMEIEIPDNKMMDGHKTLGNPTGRNVIFLSSGSDPIVYCFVMATLT